MESTDVELSSVEFVGATATHVEREGQPGLDFVVELARLSALHRATIATKLREMHANLAPKGMQPLWSLETRDEVFRKLDCRYVHGVSSSIRDLFEPVLEAIQREQTGHGLRLHDCVGVFLKGLRAGQHGRRDEFVKRLCQVLDHVFGKQQGEESALPVCAVVDEATQLTIDEDPDVRAVAKVLIAHLKRYFEDSGWNSIEIEITRRTILDLFLHDITEQQGYVVKKVELVLPSFYAVCDTKDRFGFTGLLTHTELCAVLDVINSADVEKAKAEFLEVIQQLDSTITVHHFTEVCIPVFSKQFNAVAMISCLEMLVVAYNLCMTEGDEEYGQHFQIHRLLAEINVGDEKSRQVRTDTHDSWHISRFSTPRQHSGTFELL